MYKYTSFADNAPRDAILHFLTPSTATEHFQAQPCLVLPELVLCLGREHREVTLNVHRKHATLPPPPPLLAHEFNSIFVTSVGPNYAPYFYPFGAPCSKPKKGRIEGPFHFSCYLNSWYGFSNQIRVRHRHHERDGRAHAKRETSDPSLLVTYCRFLQFSPRPQLEVLQTEESKT